MKISEKNWSTKVIKRSTSNDQKILKKSPKYQEYLGNHSNTRICQCCDDHMWATIDHKVRAWWYEGWICPSSIMNQDDTSKIQICIFFNGGTKPFQLLSTWLFMEWLVRVLIPSQLNSTQEEEIFVIFSVIPFLGCTPLYSIDISTIFGMYNHIICVIVIPRDWVDEIQRYLQYKETYKWP